MAFCSFTRRRIRGISCPTSSLTRAFRVEAEKSFAPATLMYTLEPSVQVIFAVASGHSCRMARKIVNCAVRI